jgi:hypothetical protein
VLHPARAPAHAQAASRTLSLWPAVLAKHEQACDGMSVCTDSIAMPPRLGAATILPVAVAARPTWTQQGAHRSGGAAAAAPGSAAHGRHEPHPPASVTDELLEARASPLAQALTSSLYHPSLPTTAEGAQAAGAAAAVAAVTSPPTPLASGSGGGCGGAAARTPCAAAAPAATLGLQHQPSSDGQPHTPLSGSPLTSQGSCCASQLSRQLSSTLSPATGELLRPQPPSFARQGAAAASCAAHHSTAWGKGPQHQPSQHAPRSPLPGLLPLRNAALHGLLQECSPAQRQQVQHMQRAPPAATCTHGDGSGALAMALLPPGTALTAYPAVAAALQRSASAADSSHRQHQAPTAGAAPLRQQQAAAGGSAGTEQGAGAAAADTPAAEEVQAWMLRAALLEDELQGRALEVQDALQQQQERRRLLAQLAASLAAAAATGSDADAAAAGEAAAAVLGSGGGGVRGANRSLYCSAGAGRGGSSGGAAPVSSGLRWVAADVR